MLSVIIGIILILTGLGWAGLVFLAGANSPIPPKFSDNAKDYLWGLLTVGLGVALIIW